jgi:hypothetical protein
MCHILSGTRKQDAGDGLHRLAYNIPAFAETKATRAQPQALGANANTTEKLLPGLLTRCQAAAQGYPHTTCKQLGQTQQLADCLLPLTVLPS